MSIIEIDNVSKHFQVVNRRTGVGGALRDLFGAEHRLIKAVDGINLRIEPGEVVGYLGPNGAGKSTTIKMMSGILKPSAGRILVDGRSPYEHRRQVAQDFGVVFGQRTQLWWNLPVIESFRLLREIYRVDERTYQQQMALFDDLVTLRSLHRTPARELSLGQRMLCDVVAAFLHRPKVVFLDEPTIGLDVAVKSKIRGVIQSLNASQRTTIILTTHDLGDVEALCNRIVLIDGGKVIFDGPTAKVTQLFGAYRTLKVELGPWSATRPEPVSAVASRLREKLSGREIPTVAITEPGWIDVNVNPEQVPLLDVLHLLMTEFPVQDVRIVELSLPTVIQRVYEGALQ